MLFHSIKNRNDILGQTAQPYGGCADYDDSVVWRREIIQIITSTI